MRRFLPWLLLLLLALRGLTGTAMASDGLPPPPLQTVAAFAAPSHVLHGMDTHQSTMAGAPAATATAEQACDSAPGAGCASHSYSPACSACDICHSALPAPPVLAAVPSPADSTTPSGATTPFASAQAALALKPPIC